MYFVVVQRVNYGLAVNTFAWGKIAHHDAVKCIFQSFPESLGKGTICVVMVNHI